MHTILIALQPHSLIDTKPKPQCCLLVVTLAQVPWLDSVTTNLTGNKAVLYEFFKPPSD